MSTKEAVEKLTSELKNDAGFRETYKANIATAFQLEFDKQFEIHKPNFSKWLFTENGVHEISNKAADNFLNLWCS